MRLHLTVLLRLVVRIEQLARDQRDIPTEFARVADAGSSPDAVGAAVSP